MQISPQHNHLITTAFAQSQPERQSIRNSRTANGADEDSRRENQATRRTNEVQTLPADPELIRQRVEANLNAQPLFQQQLSHRGTQARNLYQGVALTAEPELLNRLDEIV